ncbi:DUF1015 domain-containing protein [bacterium]|nr:DUF1015 domain-containing protein [bacterium]
MARVRPFRGMRPVPDKIAQVASPPYDVLNSAEARIKVKGNPVSFLHIVKPEIDLPEEIDLHDPKVYAKAGENLRKFISDGVMRQDDVPCYYVYKLRMGDHEQVGIVVAASAEEYEQDLIKKHEFTRPDKENDRMTHIDSLNAQCGPVFLTYRADAKIDTLISKAMQEEPVYDFTGDYDVQHTLYIISNADEVEAIRKAFEAVPALYVADGHHRSAAGTRVAKARREANANHTGEEEYNFWLAVIFPDNQMKILDYNRVVQDLNGNTKEQFISRIEEKFTVTAYNPSCSGCCDRAYHPEGFHCFGMYIDSQWYKLRALEHSYDAADPIKSLDVSIMQENLLNPILGIDDPRTNTRINFVGGIRGLGELEKLVDSGDFKVAFALYPTSIDQLLAVADAGEVMPPKSTWFEPKLASGVVVHMLD